MTERERAFTNLRNAVNVFRYVFFLTFMPAAIRRAIENSEDVKAVLKSMEAPPSPSAPNPPEVV